MGSIAPPVSVVGRPLPFRSSTGATVVNPLEALRSQFVAQQVQAAISADYQGVPPEQCQPSLLRASPAGQQWGVNPQGFPYGVTLLNGSPGNDCPVAATFPETAPTFTRPRTRGQPRSILINSTVPQSAFYYPGNTSYSTVSFIDPKVLARGNTGLINGPPGPCGNGVLSAVIGGPNHKNQ